MEAPSEDSRMRATAQPVEDVHFRRVGIALASAMTAFCVLSSSASAITRRVPSEIPDIQAALDSSATGDTVLVAPGEYSWTSGPLTFRGKDLVLRSENGPEDTILRSAPGQGAFYLTDRETRNARVEGFRISIGNDVGPTGTIWIQGSSPTIDDCLIAGNGGWAIAVVGTGLWGTFPLITNTVVAFNSSPVWGSAIAVVGDAGAEIEGCTIHDNSNPSAGCDPNAAQIYVVTSGFLVSLSRTLITGSPDDPPISCNGNDNFALSCCNIYGNACGDYEGCLASWLGANGNISADPLYCDPTPEALDFSLAPDSPCLPGNHPDGASCDLIGARGEGCAPTTTTPASWGRLKALFR